jgi:hypothetical protein
MKALLAACLFSFAPAAHAVDADFSFLLQNELRSISTSGVNPGNRAFGLASRLHQGELRAELQQSWRVLDFTARPRLKVNLARVNGANAEGLDAFFQEVFVRANLHDRFSLSLGRIQFGWGPAESVTPTNWLAPEIQLEPSPYFQQLGYTRAQANFTFGQGFSLVAAAELPPLPDHWSTNSNGREAPPEAFRKRSFAKAEWNWDNANKVLGLVGGQERRAAGELWRAGAYGSLTLSDAWQIYFDGVMRQGAPGQGWKPFAVAGARYTLEGGAEFHLEGIRNETGFTRAERRAAEATLSGLGDLTLRELLADRATTLLGRNYAYLSFGWPNASFFPSWAQTPVVYVRALHSLEDHSTTALLTTEVGFKDYYTVGLYGALAAGPRGSEMRQLYDGLLGLVGKVSF